MVIFIMGVRFKRLLMFVGCFLMVLIVMIVFWGGLIMVLKFWMLNMFKLDKVIVLFLILVGSNLLFCVFLVSFEILLEICKIDFL